jgi:Protein of unknown function (DUF3558)
MLGKRGFLMTGLLIPLLGACGASSSTTSPTASQSTASTPTPAVPTPTPPLATAVPTSFDPCQIVTSSEASAIAGVTYGPGLEKTNSGNGKECVYGSETTNIFTVGVGVATDAATADADWATEEAKAKAAFARAVPPGITLAYNISDTSISGADRAAEGTMSAKIETETIAGCFIYLLKGPVFVNFGDLTVGHAAPALSALESEADTVVGRI